MDPNATSPGQPVTRPDAPTPPPSQNEVDGLPVHNASDQRHHHYANKKSQAAAQSSNHTKEPHQLSLDERVAHHDTSHERQFYRLLLIEDDPAHAELVTRLIHRNADWSVELLHKRNLTEALHVLSDDHVDAVLTDLHLPDSQGLDTLRDVLEWGGSVPVLVLTSVDDVTFGREAVKSGADDYLVKSDLTPGLLTRTVLYAIERKRIRLRLRQTTRELIRSNRDLEAFARIVSHDLKTPLAVIQMDIEQAERAIGQKDGQAAMLESLLSAREELNNVTVLINDLLTFARVGGQPPEFKPVSLSKVAQRAADRALITSPHLTVHNVEFHIPPDLPLISGAESLLQQLFENLVGNALKYRSEATPDVRISAHRQGSRVEVSVSDNGLGIPPDERQRVVRMFERIEGRPQHGTGIGLAIAQRIIDMHGGTMTITDGHGLESGEEGATPGTAFHFSFKSATR